MSVRRKTLACTSKLARRRIRADGSLIRAALNDIARAGNMSQLAREAGMSREGLYKALSADGKPQLRHGDADRSGHEHAGSDHHIAWQDPPVGAR